MQANKELLKELPPPLVALEYYKGGDLYMFDDFQTTSRPDPRRPGCKCGQCLDIRICYTLLWRWHCSVAGGTRLCSRSEHFAAASNYTERLYLLRSNLYDVFSNIRDDELEHVKTMTACEDNSIMKDLADLKANKRESEQRRLRAQKSAAGA